MPRKMLVTSIVPKSRDQRTRTAKKSDKEMLALKNSASQSLPAENTKMVGKTDFLIDIYLWTGSREEVLAYLDYFGVPEFLRPLAIAQIEYLAVRTNNYLEGI